MGGSATNALMPKGSTVCGKVAAICGGTYSHVPAVMPLALVNVFFTALAILLWGEMA